jgi:chromosome segregation ATPase
VGQLESARAETTREVADLRRLVEHLAARLSAADKKNSELERTVAEQRQELMNMREQSARDLASVRS